MQSTERFEKVSIDHLVPYARNARVHSKEQILQLRASLREFGFVSPCILDRDYNIIAGHGRVLAAREEGISDIPCVFVEHLTDNQKRAYILADNRLALNAGWDEDNLLNREFETHGPRAVLLTDITYIINGKAPRCYMSTIIDACTKELLAWVLSESLDIDFVLETVNQLTENYGISLTADTLINSDQGSHYTSIKFIQLIKDSKLRQSMSRRTNCWDNAPQESFYGHMKDEIDISQCTTFEEIRKVISDWTDYYSSDRYQWDLAKLAPREYYKYVVTGEYPLTIPRAKGKH